jgi:hypothetical protein
VKIDHVGNGFTRIEKVADIARRPALLQLLKVCDISPTSNCGECGKCKRTLAMLKIVNADTPSFPTLSDDVIAMWLRLGVAEADFLYETSCYAKISGNNELLKILGPGNRAVLRGQVLCKLLATPLLRSFKGKKQKTLSPWGFGPQPKL